VTGAGAEQAASRANTKRDGETGSESEWDNLYFLLGLPLFFAIILAGGLLVRRILKSSHNSEVSFQGLQAEQIVAKITSKI
jgi:flagellar biogenesis protein FliO